MVTKQVNLSLPRGCEEKRILREVAKILGCPSGGMAPKQAIQGHVLLKSQDHKESRDLMCVVDCSSL